MTRAVDTKARKTRKSKIRTGSWVTHVMFRRSSREPGLVRFLQQAQGLCTIRVKYHKRLTYGRCPWLLQSGPPPRKVVSTKSQRHRLEVAAETLRPYLRSAYVDRLPGGDHLALKTVWLLHHHVRQLSPCCVLPLTTAAAFHSTDPSRGRRAWRSAQRHASISSLVFYQLRGAGPFPGPTTARLHEYE